MNNHSFAYETKFRCDLLLQFAEWLDSQDHSSTISAFNRHIGIYDSDDSYRRLTPDMIYDILGNVVDRQNNFLNASSNKERVLAVLMLRSAILAGDSFV